MTSDAPKFVQEVLGTIGVNKGDDLKVSQIPDDGTFPTGTTQYEKRAIAEHMPIWNKDLCIQCGQCTVVCPHAVIRAKAFDPKYLAKRLRLSRVPTTRQRNSRAGSSLSRLPQKTAQVAAFAFNSARQNQRMILPLRAINLKSFAENRAAESANWNFFFKDIPDNDPSKLNLGNAKFLAMKRPLFEFSGACAGCGETPYVKLLSQLYGDRAVIANRDRIVPQSTEETSQPRRTRKQQTEKVRHGPIPFSKTQQNLDLVCALRATNSQFMRGKLQQP